MLLSEADNFKFITRYGRALKQFSLRLPLKYFGTMKKSFQEKLRNKINFVKPLYRKKSDQVSNKIIPFNDRILKLRGDDYDVNTVLRGSNVINVKSKVSKEYKVTLPSAFDSVQVNVCKENDGSRNFPAINKYETLSNSQAKDNGVKYQKSIMELDGTRNLDENRSTKIVTHKAPETWLRVYPAQKIIGETTSSVIIRCVICQLGITTFLILWTIIGVFVIQSFEGPHEAKISIEFEKAQNQLVIDLATELRQITPLSPKWKYAIERRMEDERKLTLAAVGNGAKLKPGQFWNLSGTFLFTVYIMTALGFGAPVPHTLWGRTCALIYALLAVPMHIYLMVNTSTCVVVKLEEYVQSIRKTTKRKSAFSNSKESSNNGGHTEPKLSKDRSFCKTIISCLKKYHMGRGLPLAMFLYFLLGVMAFGVLRAKDAMDSLLFPLEFTTTGGLEHVESSTRIFYGLYIEGAMCLLACTLATVRRYGSNTASNLAKNYRLLVSDRCKECKTADFT